MRNLIGCAAWISVVPLLIGSSVALFLTRASLPTRVVIATMPAAIMFVAVLILISRDNARYRRHKLAVRKMLLLRKEKDDFEFCSQFPNIDESFLRLTREGVASFFDVSVGCIHPTDQLDKDLYFKELEPSFHMFVTYYVLTRSSVIDAPFVFRADGLSDVGSLASEISRIQSQLSIASKTRPT